MRVEGAFIANSRQFYPTATVGLPTRLIAGGTTIPGRDEDSVGFLTYARVNFDARTETAYGTLRSYFRPLFQRLQGVYSGGGAAGGANTFANQGGNSVSVSRGYIQFAGITAGRVQSLYDFFADNYVYEQIANSDQLTTTLSYTFNSNNSQGPISATIGLESHEVRTDGIGTIQGGAFEVGGRNQGATALTTRYGGAQIPDVIGVLRDDAPWGVAQLSAAYHQVNTVAGPFAGTGGQGTQHNDRNGFAVQGGVKINLPMLAAGDVVWLEGNYQEGAFKYQDSEGWLNQGFQSRYLGGFQHLDHDAIAIGVPNSTNGTYNLSLSRGFSTLVAVNHYYSPYFHQVLAASYEQSFYGRGAANVDWTLGGLGFGSEYRIENQFLWDPVKNLEFGLETDYAHIDQHLAHNYGQLATALPVGITKDPNGYEVRLRIQRDF